MHAVIINQPKPPSANRPKTYLRMLQLQPCDWFMIIAWNALIWLA